MRVWLLAACGFEALNHTILDLQSVAVEKAAFARTVQRSLFPWEPCPSLTQFSEPLTISQCAEPETIVQNWLCGNGGAGDGGGGDGDGGGGESIGASGGAGGGAGGSGVEGDGGTAGEGYLKGISKVCDAPEP